MFISDLTNDQLIMLIAAATGGALISSVVVVWYLIRAGIKRRKNRMAQDGKETMSDAETAASSPKQIPEANATPARPRTYPASARETAVSSAIDPPVDLSARLGLSPSPEPPATARPTTTTTSSPSGGGEMPLETEEIFRLWRDVQSGQLVIEVAGKRYRRLSEVSDKAIGEHILQVTAHLLHFTNGLILAREGIKSLAVPLLKPLGSLPLSLTATASPIEAPVAEPPSLSPPPAQMAGGFPQNEYLPPPGPVPAAKQGPGLAGPSGSNQTPATGASSFGLNLAEEINEIVQARLAASPLAATTTIQVSADPSGGISIVVNGRRFQTPEEIVDPDVKALVKGSIRAWEES
ncbi:MAG: hypothetical protein ACE5H9_02125 [Anaerolineae bacterium]